MEKETVRLSPFGRKIPAAFEITCTVGRQSGRMDVVFRLQGDLKAVAIPPRSCHPVRRPRLWEDTCLECFFGPAASTVYWEVNLSPAGHWNVYRFEDYRRGMREEAALQGLTPELRSGPNLLCLGAAVDLGSLGLDRQPLALGFAAVIRSGNGGKTYWAAAHAGPQPDFHRRETFVLQSAPVY